MAEKQPNVLFIMADQLTALALGCYGNPDVKTPNLDRLADRGVTFVNNYCNCPICAPSRASMSSGRLCDRLQNYDNGTEFPASIPTFMHHLRAADYEVVLSGKMHFVGPDQLHGFERRLTTDIYPSTFGWTKNWRSTEPTKTGMVEHLKRAGAAPWTRQLQYDQEVHFRSLEQIREWGVQEQHGGLERPFFLMASYTHPHDPPIITQPWWDLYKDVEVAMPNVAPAGTPEIPSDRWLVEYLGLDRVEITDEETRLSRIGYYAMTSYFDSRVGELIDELEKQSLLDDTLIIVTADHGDMVGEHGLWFKRSYYEWSSRVPLIVSCPARYPEGRRVTQSTSLVDVFPTLLEMLDLPAAPEGTLDGHSAAALLRGDDPGWKDEAVIDFTSAGAIHPWRAVRHGDYKYVAVHTESPLLFDTAHDPNEFVNLAGRPEYAAVEAQMAARAQAGWDGAKIEARELVAQQERLFIYEMMQRGQPTYWDHTPDFDGRRQYSRGYKPA